MEAVLSSKTSGLCFNKDDFMIDDFSVDKFVSNYRKYVSLETLLADLGVYHRILCSAMIELINRDYADFLNLSSNLVGLDKSIKILCSPLEKLEVGINDNRKKLYDTMTEASSMLHEYKAAYKKKVLAHHALCVLEGLDKLLKWTSFADEEVPLDILQRIALEYNFTQFHMNKASCIKNIKNKEGVIEKIADCLKHHLEKKFLASLSTNDEACLLKVLRIYAVLSMETEAERIHFEHIVKPYMECHITEENVVKHGLSYIYGKIMDFVESSALLLEFTQVTLPNWKWSVSGFEFLVNSVFPGIVYCFDYITPVHIYAHGNPERFHENYRCTMNFLDEFEKLCKIESRIEKLRRHEVYQNFISKWNLDVYFQIIFSEIAGKLEKNLLEGFIYPKDLKLIKKDSYLVNSCNTLSECVNLCYNEKVFLKPLGHCFFRLNLKLISRFCKATRSNLLQDNEKNPISTAVIIHDVEIMVNEFQELYEEKISRSIQFPILYSDPFSDSIRVSFMESVQLLESIIPIANTVMTKALTKQCCAHLKLISDIPRHYRKTNREIPRKASNYVALVFNNLVTFISETESVLPIEFKKRCLQNVMDEIITKLDFIIRDLLISIERMEHSLKILKRARDKNPTGSSGCTDDDKIRLQLIIDVKTFEEKIMELELNSHHSQTFGELTMLMVKAERNLPENVQKLIQIYRK